MRPHRCYLKSVMPLLNDVPEVFALAHITGGGLADNIQRVIPADIRVSIDRRSWTPLPIFSLIQQSGNVPSSEMYRTFNMGIGFVLIVAREVAGAVVQRLQQSGENAAVIGEIQRGPHDVQIV